MLGPELNQQSSRMDFESISEEATEQINIVASFENFCAIYQALNFTDPITDAERIEEFKWITAQMNTFLTRMRAKLRTCKSKEAMIDLLSASIVPAGKINLSDRKSFAFQKLRMRWILNLIESLSELEDTEEENNE